MCAPVKIGPRAGVGAPRMFNAFKRPGEGWTGLGAALALLALAVMVPVPALTIPLLAAGALVALLAWIGRVTAARRARRDELARILDGSARFRGSREDGDGP